ncbi:MAG: hypothetical protein RRY97_03815 [Oscillibacter sp.]
MANYQKMYAIVCGAASDALDALQAGDPAAAEKTLSAALEKAEELYLDDAP